jgi:hypothetical protein
MVDELLGIRPPYRGTATFVERHAAPYGRLRAMPLQSETAYRWAAGLALTAALLIVWLNAAAGLMGIEDDDPANLLYVGMLAVGLMGAIVARFEPRGLAHAMFATAFAQAVVGAMALSYPNTAGPAQIVLVHGVLVAMFAGAGFLFRFAARWRVRSAEDTGR